MIVEGKFTIPAVFKSPLLTRLVEIDSSTVSKATDKDEAIKLQVAHAFADDFEIEYCVIDDQDLTVKSSQLQEDTQ